MASRTNGFVERFQRTVLEELFVERLRITFYEAVEALQTDLDSWPRHYNAERPHQGYRNMGRRPIETIQLYLKSVTRSHFKIRSTHQRMMASRQNER